jgi:glutathione S-transferase
MLTVRTGAGSPFGRKARIAISVLGLDGKVAVEPAANQDPADPIRKQNPLGKVPVLLLDDGGTLFDSPVILEYLDMLAGGGKIIPAEKKARFEALRLQALADGILDASILLVYEGRYRAKEKHEQKWLDLQSGKVACALGYGDFRFEGRWRKDYPKLVAWLDKFAAQVPAFDATKPPAG